ncbi:effector-associated constant component EACC1 [Streptomyces sp. CA-249302]|uniref:effector-associated constant component EACC1 n=1 Tax=Streptomyces sp. CA-249302 TaxID=3240058 RepID=UPI003D8E874D
MEEVEVSVTATSDRFDADDDRWLSQVRLLHQDLGREARLAARATGGRSGTKGGGLPDVNMWLTPAVVLGVTSVIRAWIKRDRDRSVRLTWQEGGEPREFTVTSTNVDNATLQVALQEGLRATTDAPRQDADSGD